MFPPELEHRAFRAKNGEFGWTRAQIPVAVAVLRANHFAILGGELWWVRDGIKGWTGLIPHPQGGTAVYHWETDHQPGESWAEFVERGAADTLAAVERWPEPGDLPPGLAGRILYNLAWVSESEYPDLKGTT